MCAQKEYLHGVGIAKVCIIMPSTVYVIDNVTLEFYT